MNARLWNCRWLDPFGGPWTKWISFQRQSTEVADISVADWDWHWLLMLIWTRQLLNSAFYVLSSGLPGYIQHPTIQADSTTLRHEVTTHCNKKNNTIKYNRDKTIEYKTIQDNTKRTIQRNAMQNKTIQWQIIQFNVEQYNKNNTINEIHYTVSCTTAKL